MTCFAHYVRWLGSHTLWDDLLCKQTTDDLFCAPHKMTCSHTTLYTMQEQVIKVIFQFPIFSILWMTALISSLIKYEAYRQQKFWQSLNCFLFNDLRWYTTKCCTLTNWLHCLPVSWKDKVGNIGIRGFNSLPTEISRSNKISAKAIWTINLSCASLLLYLLNFWDLRSWVRHG